MTTPRARFRNGRSGNLRGGSTTVRRKTLSTAVALLVVGVAATTTTAALAHSSKSADVSKIAIATPAKANDYGWNQQGVRGRPQRRQGQRRDRDRQRRHRLRQHAGSPRAAGPQRQPVRHRPGERLQHHRPARGTADQGPDDQLRQPEEPDQGLHVRHRDLEPGRRIPRRRARGQEVDDRQARHRHLGGRHELVQAVRRLRGRRAQRQPGRQVLVRPGRPGRL